MLNAADPDLLSVDDIPVAFLHGRRLDLGRVGPCGGFGHSHGLQAQFTAGDFG